MGFTFQIICNRYTEVFDTFNIFQVCTLKGVSEGVLERQTEITILDVKPVNMSFSQVMNVLNTCLKFGLVDTAEPRNAKQ